MGEGLLPAAVRREQRGLVLGDGDELRVVIAFRDRSTRSARGQQGLEQVTKRLESLEDVVERRVGAA